MPSRVIRGEINASRSLSRVSLEADLTFRSLLVAVDDYGRCEGDPLMLKADLYPRRESVTPAMVATWVAELVAEGCVTAYEVDGVAYLQLTGHERHRSNGRRAAKSKFPDPPTAILGVPRKSEEAPSVPADVPEIRPSVVCREASSEKREDACASADGEGFDIRTLLAAAKRAYPAAQDEEAVACYVWAQKNVGIPSDLDLRAIDPIRRKVTLTQLATHLGVYLETVAPQFQSFPKFCSKIAHYAPKPKVVRPEHRKLREEDFVVMERAQ